MSAPLALFATASRGLEPLLAAELTGLGATATRERPGGVEFTGTLEVAYRACLWSRLASRVLLPLKQFPAADPDALYQAALDYDWTKLFDGNRTFAIEVAGHSATLTHTHYAGLKVKDAIADKFRAATGQRPSVDTEAPDIGIHLHLGREQASLSLDLSGESLHRRGYRKSGVEAPLRENLAAAIVLRAGWPELCAQGAPLLDPMCGSGTLVIEAALMAADVAPQLKRERFGFVAWNGHDPKLWVGIRADAQARAKTGLARALPPMRGSDQDPRAIRAAVENAQRAGVAHLVTFEQADAMAVAPGDTAGLLIANPPYGERLGTENELVKLYSLFGATLKERFGGWRAAIFTTRADLAPRLGLRAEKMYSLYNGALPAKLLIFDIPSATPAAKVSNDFTNRLNKNLTHLRKWTKRSGVTCYRAYDADLPEYAVAVDVYETAAEERHVHVQEYAAPKTIDPVKAEKRLRDALAGTQQVLTVPASRIHYKLRRGQKHRQGQQYERQAETRNFLEVMEHGCKLLVNLDDYLDSGLFLDHRPLRLRIQKEAAGKRFLNLFCYTGTATVHAAKGGAKQTLSVDLSNTYLEWAERNLLANGVRATVGRDDPRDRSRPLPAGHTLLRADCLKWLAETSALPAPPQFDVILCDPPSFSHSKKMEDVLDVKRDHVMLIRQCVALLAPGGALYFSTNRRGFKLDGEALAGLDIADITVQTLDDDFRRPPPPHKCWRIRHAPA